MLQESIVFLFSLSSYLSPYLSFCTQIMVGNSYFKVRGFTCFEKVMKTAHNLNESPYTHIIIMSADFKNR